MRGLRSDEAELLRIIIARTGCEQGGFGLHMLAALESLAKLGRIRSYVCPFDDCPQPGRRHFMATDKGLTALRVAC